MPGSNVARALRGPQRQPAFAGCHEPTIGRHHNPCGSSIQLLVDNRFLAPTGLGCDGPRVTGGVLDVSTSPDSCPTAGQATLRVKKVQRRGHARATSRAALLSRTMTLFTVLSTAESTCLSTGRACRLWMDAGTESARPSTPGSGIGCGAQSPPGLHASGHRNASECFASVQSLKNPFHTQGSNKKGPEPARLTADRLDA